MNAVFYVIYEFYWSDHLILERISKRAQRIIHSQYGNDYRRHGTGHTL